MVPSHSYCEQRTHSYLQQHSNLNFLRHCAVKLGDFTLQGAHLNASQSKGMREWEGMSHPQPHALSPAFPAYPPLPPLPPLFSGPPLRLLHIAQSQTRALHPQLGRKNKKQPCLKKSSAPGFIGQSDSSWATPISILHSPFFFPFIVKPLNI